MRRWFLALLGLAVVCAPTLATAQVGVGGASGLISSSSARRHGLTQAWFTRVDVNRSNGRVIGITQHIGEWLSIEIKAGSLVYRYSERDRDAQGRLLGPDGAAALAAAKQQDLIDGYLKPTLTEIVRADVTLYVVTDKGVIHAIDGESGQTLWVQSVGRSDFPTTEAAANDLYVAICNGSDLYLLDRRNGEVLWTRSVGGTVSAGPALSNDMVSVPTIRGAVESYRIDQSKRYAPHIYRSQGAIFGQPISTPRSIAWCTAKGHMYCADANSGRVRFRLETSDTIVGQPAYLAPRYFYCASFDGYVYCVDEVNGRMQWRYSTGGVVSKSPVAVGETVYIVTDEGELHAIDYLTGDAKAIGSAEESKTNKAAATNPPPKNPQAKPADVARWPVVSGVRDIVSVSPTRIYCLGQPGQLMIIDRNSGTVLGSMYVGLQDVVLRNQQTDRLILGTSTGLLQCLHDQKLVDPYVHEIEMEKIRSTRPAVIQKPATPMDGPMDDMPMPADDPFGGGRPMPEDDPFGGGAAPKMDDDPFGGGAAPKTNDDPFGGGAADDDDPFR